MDAAANLTLAFVEHAPLWAVGLVLFIALAVCHQAGSFAGRQTAADREIEGRSYLVSSALGLLALLTAFTFSAAQSRFDQRQELVALESNTMGTAYLRTLLAPSPWREQLGAKLLQYAEVRARFASAYEDPGQRLGNYEAQDEAQTALWAIVGDEVRANPAFNGNIPLINGINEMFDAADARLAAHEKRVPLSVLRVLALFMLVASAIVGFAAGEERRDLVISFAVLALMTLAYCMILDLDRPGSGSVTIRQAPLERTLAAIRKAEADRASAATKAAP